MNFIAKLVGKFFRYFILLALILIGIDSIGAFLHGKDSLFGLLATLAMLYLVYKFVVPLLERFVVFFTGVNLAPQQRSAPRRKGGVVERFADSASKSVGDWILSANTPRPTPPGPTPWQIQNERARKRYQARNREIYYTNQANKCPGTYDSYVASNRAKQAREDAKRY